MARRAVSRWGFCLVGAGALHLGVGVLALVAKTAKIAEAHESPLVMIDVSKTVEVGTSEPASGPSGESQVSATRPAAKRVVRQPASQARVSNPASAKQTPEALSHNAVTQQAEFVRPVTEPTAQIAVSSDAPRGLASSGALNGIGTGGSAAGSTQGYGGNDRGKGTGFARAHGPRLLAKANPCSGLFPFNAAGDRGTVTVALRVTEAGDVAESNIVEEVPRGQGFARAAESCLPRLAFEPAADRSGAPIASRSVVRLRFTRR